MEAQFDYILSVWHSRLRGDFATQAKDDYAALRNIFIREFKRRGLGKAGAIPQAVMCAKQAFDLELYRVLKKSVIVPEGLIPEKQVAPEPVYEEPSGVEFPSEVDEDLD